MARRLNRLTVREVKTLTKPGRHADGGNLYLQIAPTGSKQWVFMFQHNGRQREMGLGRAETGEVSLAEARDPRLRLAACSPRESTPSTHGSRRGRPLPLPRSPSGLLPTNMSRPTAAAGATPSTPLSGR